ncbi:MAG: restriction endonuclease subunit S [Terriglobia bacterium]
MGLKAGYKQTDVGLLPEAWDARPLAMLSSLIPSGVYGEERARAGLTAFRVATTTHIDDDDSWNDREMRIRYFTSDQLARYTPAVGDLIVVKSSGSAASIKSGKIGRVGANQAGTFVFSNFLMLLRPVHCESTFLYYYLTSFSVKRLRPSLVEASTYPNIRIGEYMDLRIPLPPLPEQRAIAGALGDVDALLSSLTQLIAKKRDLKQAVLQQLLTGKTRLPGFSGEWEEKRLGEVAALIKGRGLSKAQVCAAGTRPCVLYGELFTTYGRVITEVASKTTDEDGLPSQAGDVLVPGSTTTTGIDLATASALLQGGVALGGDINVIRQRARSFDPVFLAYYLTHVMRWAIAELAQGITIIHLYGRDLATLTLRIPGMAEQATIAAVLSDMDAELAGVEQRLAKTRALKQGMMQELLTGRTRLV